MYSRFALLTLVAVSLFGQSQTPAAQKADPALASQPPAAPPIQVQVNEVIVPITVTDDKGRFVDRKSVV